MDFKDLKEKLKAGEKVFMNNEAHQISIGDDDIRQAELQLVRKEGRDNWQNGFIIWFNGELIHHSKGWDSFKRRLEKLIEKWTLVEAPEL